MTARRIVPSLALAAGLVFLYAPIATLVLFSFNRSALVAVWAGFSTRWYGVLAADGAVRSASGLSALIACLSASLAILVALPASLAFGRLGRFRGRALLAALWAAPLVMPDVLIGIALLLLFITLETLTGFPPGQGVLTIVAGHAVLGASFATVVIEARLAVLPRDLEHAAADLGAGPAATFLHVLLPLLAPAIASAWLLAFSLSLDDVVIASFLSGPGSTTLPVLLLSRIHLGLNPEINALASVLLGVVSLVALAVAVLVGRGRGLRRSGQAG